MTMTYRVYHDCRPNGSLPRPAPGCMTLAQKGRERRNVKARDARRGGAPGERGAGAKKPRREAGQDPDRCQMPKVRRAKSRLGQPGRGPRRLYLQGMRREAGDPLMAAGELGTVASSRSKRFR